VAGYSREGELVKAPKPTAGKLDARTLRWVVRQLRGQARKFETEREESGRHGDDYEEEYWRGSRDAAHGVSDGLLKQAKALESPTKLKATRKARVRR
jgi:hypothetical protein